MSTKKDYYEILGISKNASADEIKRAFRKLAKKYHPDVSAEPESEQKFKEINEAYQVLSDSQKRAQYDQFGHQGMNFGNQDFNGFGDFNFSDIFQGFSDIFGNSSKSRNRYQKKHNIDQYFTINLNFFEAMHGITKSFIIKEENICSSCHGSGAKTSRDLKACFACDGSGTQIIRKSTIFGVIQQETICNRCQGEGQEIQRKCSECLGKKITEKEVNLEVKVPKGVDNNSRIKYEEKGKIDPLNKKKGDLYIEFKIKNNPIFKREENDLFTDIPVSYLDALLGKEIEVPTIDGLKTIELETGTNHNKIIRLKNYGAYSPYSRFNRRGHQYYRIQIQYPNKLNKEEKD